MTTAQLGIAAIGTRRSKSNSGFSPLQLDPAIHVCDNANMKPRLAAICALGVLATCGGPTLAQFPDCAHISNEGEAQCQPTGQAAYVVSDRTDGKVEVTEEGGGDGCVEVTTLPPSFSSLLLLFLSSSF